ncbi:MAG: FAD:protein FMN transferase [Saprospiraceae bacterium]|nr:FAD:protein FMN transferase [Saprospiraceae bacterium]
MFRYAFLIFVGLFIACSPSSEYIHISGETMGTTYHVTLQGDPSIDWESATEESLAQVNGSVNTYDPESEISRFNVGEGSFQFDGKAGKNHFLENLIVSKMVVEESNGHFDPTVMPLVNYWGFGTTGKRAVTLIDSSAVDSILQFVGWNNISFDENAVNKKHPSSQLDLSALAKGYGVDQIGLLLEKKGTKNYLVEIGGEVRARGVNEKGNPWRLGISKPYRGEKNREIEQIISLPNMALATSGNYRNFYQTDHYTYAHTINPITGFPEESSLLSASVIAKDCILADAFATAFMVMGLGKATEKVEELEGIEALFIFNDGKGGLEYWASPGLDTLLTKQ